MKIFCFDKNDDKFNIAMNIRNTVFELEQGAIAEEEIDKYDLSDKTIYLLIYDDNEPCATGRIAFTDKGVKIGRIAVLKSQRGKGTGKYLVEQLCDKAVELGAKDIFVDSQLHAVGFYERLGFEKTGESEITDRGIRHLPMIKRYEE